MHASALRIELRVPGVRSLKAKRSVLRPLTDDLRTSFGASVAEVGFQDQWQRATVGVALVASSHADLTRRALAIRKHLERRESVEVLDIVTSYLEDL
jgi:uncharacterized protein YlxP (DUF503 family)